MMYQIAGIERHLTDWEEGLYYLLIGDNTILYYCLFLQIMLILCSRKAAENEIYISISLRINYGHLLKDNIEKTRKVKLYKED